MTVRQTQTYTVILRDASDTYKVYVLSATSPEGAAQFCKRVWQGHGGTSPSVEFVFTGEVDPIKTVGAMRYDEIIHLYEMDTDS